MKTDRVMIVDDALFMRSVLRRTLEGLSCMLEPVPDEGGEAPSSLLGRDIRLDEDTVRLTQEGSYLYIHSSMSEEPFMAARGRLYGRVTPCTLHMGCARLNPVTRVFAGYGMQGGALVLRLFIPEALIDMRLELREGPEGVALCAYDVHNPAKPVRMDGENA